jgi:hypothetical protein
MDQAPYSAKENDFQDKMLRNDLELFDTVTSIVNYSGFANASLRDYKFLDSVKLIKNRTMLPVKRLYDLYNSVTYVNKWKIPGQVVEIGTWRCGALALTLLADETNQREIVGFDTFTGHLPPLDDEFDIRGNSMYQRYLTEVKENNHWTSSIDKTECIEFLSKFNKGNAGRVNLIQGNILNSIMNFKKRRLQFCELM